MCARPRTVSDDDVMAAVGRAVTRAGPARLTLADVADEAGIARPTLLQRYGSKRGLLLAFAAWGAGGVADHFAAARAAFPAPLRALREALAGMTDDVRTPEAMANHLAFLQLDLADAEFHGYALAHARSVRAEVAGLLAEAAARGELPAGARPARLAEAVHTMFNGALVTWAVVREGTVEQAVTRALDALLGAEARRA